MELEKAKINYCLPICLKSFIPDISMDEAALALEYDPKDGCRLHGLKEYIGSKGFDSIYVPANTLADEYQFECTVDAYLKHGIRKYWLLLSVDWGIKDVPKKHTVKIESVDTDKGMCLIMSPSWDEPQKIICAKTDDLFIATRRSEDGMTVIWRKE